MPLDACAAGSPTASWCCCCTGDRLRGIVITAASGNYVPGSWLAFLHDDLRCSAFAGNLASQSLSAGSRSEEGRPEGRQGGAVGLPGLP